MKKLKILGIVLALSIAVLLAAVAPAIANPPASNTESVFGRVGRVVLNLPEGGKCNKTDIAISFADIDDRSTKGAEDYIEVGLWIASQSRFRTVAFIDDNPAALASVKAMLSGVPYIQYIQVADSELEVWKEGDTLVANLTTAVDIKFGEGLASSSIYRALNFTLPPMTVKFVKTGPVYDVVEESGSYSGWPGASNWAYANKIWNAPAFVEVSIPTWLGTPLPVVGFYREKMVLVVTKP